MSYTLKYMDEFEDYHSTFIGEYDDKEAGIAAFHDFIKDAGVQPDGSWLELWDVSTYETILEHNY